MELEPQRTRLSKTSDEQDLLQEPRSAPVALSRAELIRRRQRELRRAALQRRGGHCFCAPAESNPKSQS